MGEDADGAGLLVWSPSDSRLQTDKKWKLKHRIQTETYPLTKEKGKPAQEKYAEGIFPHQSLCREADAFLVQLNGPNMR